MSCTIPTEEKMVECPFDRNHKLKSNYLQFHIVRCMKNYPNHVACPFNSLHRIEKSKLKEHIKTCSEQSLLMSKVVKESFTNHHGDVSQTPIHVGNPAWNTEEEDWSTEY